VATIKDVARLAGVGLGTASRVVSGKGAVAPATAERVRRAIEQLEFRPSHAARSLLSGSSQMIGVYIPVLKGTFYTPILQIIDMELRANGQHMVVAFGHGLGNARQQAMEGIHFLLERGCDGLIVISDALLEEDIAALGPKNKYLVVLNRLYKDIREQCFSVDHKQGGKLAAVTLLEQGHRKFAVVTGPSSAIDNIARISGFIGELEKHGIAADKVTMVEGDYSPESGWMAVGTLLASRQKFTALFCANDEMAVGAISRLHDAGVSVPGMVSVMGYDDTLTAEYSAPRLTSVHVPWREVTLSALNWLLNQCYGGSRPVRRKLPVSMSWRSSVAKV
jgi:LacI family transcriptional regulator